MNKYKKRFYVFVVLLFISVAIFALPYIIHFTDFLTVACMSIGIILFVISVLVLIVAYRKGFSYYDKDDTFILSYNDKERIEKTISANATSIGFEKIQNDKDFSLFMLRINILTSCFLLVVYDAVYLRQSINKTVEYIHNNFDEKAEMVVVYNMIDESDTLTLYTNISDINMAYCIIDCKNNKFYTGSNYIYNDMKRRKIILRLFDGIVQFDCE